MKRTMMLAIIMIILIVLMTSFDLTLSPTKPLELSPEMAAQALYVCPANSALWDVMSKNLQLFKKPVLIMVLFATMVLMATWGWALYQNLLKDKFSRDAYKTPWGFTKLLFWGVVIIIMLMASPNHFRLVRVDGDNRSWVLCENNTPGALPVRADMVQSE